MTVPVSQNGYSANDRSVIRSVRIPGTDVDVLVRVGPAGDLLAYVAERWHREVEPLRAADGVLDCWGYAPRTIRGGIELSNHASGTACDFRARDHPLGTDPTQNFTSGEVRAISRIVMDCAPAIRWGGNYVGRKDGMHVEVVSSEQVCAQVLARLVGPGAEGGGGPLSLGDAGPRVAELQRFLNAFGWRPALPLLPVTGNYREQTRDVVRAAQGQCGVGGSDADGTVVGPRTLAAFRSRGFRG